MKARLWLKMAVAVAGLAIGLVQVHSQTTNIVYAFTDLGSLGGEKAIAYGINNSGQVVGESDVPGAPAEPHAFLYSGGVMTDLGVLGGSSFLSNSVAQAINNEGQIVGYSTATNAGTGGYHAFLYQNGVMSDLGALGTNSSKAYAINDLGQIVGESDIGVPIQDPSMRAFLYTNGVMTNLGAPTNKGSEAFGINNSSQIVGDYETNNIPPQTNTFGTNTAFLDSSGSISNLSETSGLGALRAYTAYAINNAGQVTGYAVNSSTSERHVYLYNGGAMTDLGALDSTHTNTEGLAINNSGQVVGTATTNSTGFGGYGITNSGRAFLYSGGAMHDLNSLAAVPSGWTLTSATGINDLGQIVGSVEKYVPGQLQHAFLLTPMPTLTIAATGTNCVMISWPTNGPAFTLMQSGSVAEVNWTAVTNVPVVTNGMNEVMILPSGGMQFFQLMLAQ